MMPGKKRQCTNPLFLLVTMGLASMTFGLLGCEQEDPVAPSPADPSVSTVDKVEDDPARFLGQTVTLTGEIDEVHTNRAFELEELTWLFDEEVLVLTRVPVYLGTERLENEKVVSVTGRVEMLEVAEVEKELGWDLDPELEVEWESKPVVVAQNIEAIEGYARWSEEDHPEGELVSLWAVYTVPTPLDLEGASIDLDSAPVAEKGETGLWLGYNDVPELYVVPSGAAKLPAEANSESEVHVKGTLEKLPPMAEASEQWKLSGAEKERLENDALYLKATELEVLEERSAKLDMGRLQAEG